MKKQKTKIQKERVGGQAVIEGVMMRSPHYVTVAVRKPNGKIALKKDAYQSLTKRVKIFGLPIIRGGVILVESLVLGIKALNLSSTIAMEEMEKEKNKKTKKTDTGNKVMIAGTLIFALGAGFGLFFYLPLLLTELIGIESGILFNLIDGAIRLIIFLSYLLLISLWKEIRRIFEYHGAEHKSIFAYEMGNPLTIQGVNDLSTQHPRCGTSFLLVVMLVSLIVFMILGKPDQLTDRFIRFLFIPLIGGISYEIILLSGKKYGEKISRILVAPGLWLQKITTKEPDHHQIEVALVALKASLDQKIDCTIEELT